MLRESDVSHQFLQVLSVSECFPGYILVWLKSEHVHASSVIEQQILVSHTEGFLKNVIQKAKEMRAPI